MVNKVGTADVESIIISMVILLWFMTHTILSYERYTVIAKNKTIYLW